MIAGNPRMPRAATPALTLKSTRRLGGAVTILQRLQLHFNSSSWRVAGGATFSSNMVWAPDAESAAVLSILDCDILDVSYPNGWNGDRCCKRQ